jgi:hypothetical protein
VRGPEMSLQKVASASQGISAKDEARRVIEPLPRRPIEQDTCTPRYMRVPRIGLHCPAGHTLPCTGRRHRHTRLCNKSLGTSRSGAHTPRRSNRY